MTPFKAAIAASALALLSVGGVQAQQAAQTNIAAGPAAAPTMQLMAAAIPSADIDRSIAFYTKGLGLKAGTMANLDGLTEGPLLFPGGSAYILLIKANGAAATPASAAVPRPNVKRVVIQVPDLAAVEKQLTAAGYKVPERIAAAAKFHAQVNMIDDPDGNVVELVQRGP